MAEVKVYCQCCKCMETFEVDADLRGQNLYVEPQSRITIRRGRITHHCGGNGRVGDIKLFTGQLPANLNIRKRRPSRGKRVRSKQVARIIEPNT